MAFASAILETTVFGNKKVIFGTFTNAGGDVTIVTTDGADGYYSAYGV